MSSGSLIFEEEIPQVDRMMASGCGGLDDLADGALYGVAGTGDCAHLGPEECFALTSHAITNIGNWVFVLGGLIKMEGIFFWQGSSSLSRDEGYGNDVIGDSSP